MIKEALQYIIGLNSTHTGRNRRGNLFGQDPVQGQF